MWKGDEGETVSYWEKTENGLQNSSLDKSIETDVCIIGGGISGMTTAYLLAKAGKRVVVIDDGVIGGMLVSDLILGRENPLAEVYEPSRILTQSITEAIPEVISSTLPYVDWLKGGDVDTVDEIKPGMGELSATAQQRSPPIATKAESFISVPLFARIWDASCNLTVSSAIGLLTK